MHNEHPPQPPAGCSGVPPFLRLLAPPPTAKIRNGTQLTCFRIFVVFSCTDLKHFDNFPNMNLSSGSFLIELSFPVQGAPFLFVAVLLCATSADCFYQRSSAFTLSSFRSRFDSRCSLRGSFKGLCMSTPATGKSEAASSASAPTPVSSSTPPLASKPTSPSTSAPVAKPTSQSEAEPKTAIANPMMVGKVNSGRPNIPVTFEDVSKATHDIRGAVYVTPCARNPELSELTGCNLWLKVT
jgi:hypothetical protein